MANPRMALLDLLNKDEQGAGQAERWLQPFALVSPARRGGESMAGCGGSETKRGSRSAAATGYLED